MTKLCQRKQRVAFITDGRVRGRNIVVECKPYYLQVRESGRRWSYQVSWEAIYWLGVKQAEGSLRKARRIA